MSGKGSKRRPTLIPAKDFGENWAKIFGAKKKSTKENKTETKPKEKDNG